ncbi:hypothetical protein HDZ31DRAFT_32557 [Schizophyllum fasciatum]
MFCGGCMKNYDSRGWSSHVRQTPNPNCRKFFARLYSTPRTCPSPGSRAAQGPPPTSSLTRPSLLPSSSVPRPNPAQVDPADPRQERTIPVDPTGDFFGDYDIDYAMEDLPGMGDTGEGQQGALETMGLEEEDANYDSDEESDTDIEALNASLEHAFEPERPVAPDGKDNDGDIAMDDDDAGLAQSQPEADDHARQARDHMEEQLRRHPFVVRYPGRAGEIVAGQHEQPSNAQYEHALRGAPSRVYGVFGHRLAWDLARWAKARDISANALNDLLSIPELADKLDLPYQTAAQLNGLVDTLPGRPRFQRKDIVVAGQRFDVYFRDIIECVRALVSDIDLCPVLVFAPEKHYVDDKKTNRFYHDMHTGEWWWATQDELEARRPGATIIPIILSSDKTQLTSFRNKSAYPVYMTIGNIPKEVRRKPSTRAYVLLGYLPTSRLLHIKSDAARRRCLANLFHTCLRRIVRPLKAAGLDGINMATADGAVRRMHPIHACYVGDYPEQVLCTCVKSGTCAQCGQPNSSLGQFDRAQADGLVNGYRELGPVLDVINTYDQDPVGYASRCRAIGLRPTVKPFWQGLPFAHPFRAITPDVLHQLYQGVVKHLVSWLVDVFGAVEVDARCRRMPPNHNIRIFMDGISSLSFVTGQTHDEICRILLGLILDMPLPGRVHPRVVRAVRAILDFLYLAQHPIHTDETLQDMNDALESFHREKDNIKMFGTTDNFNTQYTERLHIDFAKDAYAASNKKEEFAQMTIWLERKEKMHRHEQYIRWCSSGRPALQPWDWTPPGLELSRTMRLSKRPSATVRLDALERDYGAEVFIPALKRFIAMSNNSSLTRRTLEDALHSVILRFNKVKVWHRIKFVSEDRLTGKRITHDSIHARPARKDKRGNVIPGRFDTALLSDGSSKETGVQGNRVGRIRAIFSLPDAALASLFRPGVERPKHLAYVEWYTPFASRPERDHRMYRVSKCLTDSGQRMLASIVPIDHIRRSIHLIPKYGRTAPAEWTSSNVLDRCSTFYANCFTDRHLYRVLY